MRVISGKARGMRIECPSGDDVRPTPDMARQAIYNILQNVIEGATVLDLFSGSGAMGIEALSRGAAWCVFVERSTQVRAHLEKNLAHTRLAGACDVLTYDALHCVRRLAQMKRQFDIVFVGPPFPLLADPTQRMELLAELDRLVESGLIRAGGTAIFQHERIHPIPERTARWTMTDRRTYGRNVFTFYDLLPSGEAPGVAKPQGSPTGQ